jgi:TRAP-type C4-dicarboxylate transport system permease small subunit
MKRTADWVYQALQKLLTLLMGLLMLPIVLQIVARFSPSIPHLIWTEEVARFCFIWIIMIGAMIGVRDEAHFHLDLLSQPRNARTRAIRALWVHGAMLVMALTFVWFGYRFALFGWAQASELTGLNMLTIHAAWPISGIVFTLFLSEKIAGDMALMRDHPHETSRDVSD